METQTQINAVIFALLTIIGGYTYVGTTDEFGIPINEATHFCESREIKMYCDRLSPSEITCYPTEARIGYKRCSEGWKEISTVIATIKSRNPNKIHCTNQGCT